MTENLRTLREHLSNARLYAGEAPVAGAHAAAWRAALLVRYPAPARRRRPAAAGTSFWRLALLIALPLCVAGLITALALAGFDFTPPVPGPLPTAELLGRSAAAPHYVWYGLAGLGVLITFLVRGRLPRLLPLDW